MNRESKQRHHFLVQATSFIPICIMPIRTVLKCILLVEYRGYIRSWLTYTKQYVLDVPLKWTFGIFRYNTDRKNQNIQQLSDIKSKYIQILQFRTEISEEIYIYITCKP